MTTGRTVLRRHVRRLRTAQLARYLGYAVPFSILAGFAAVRWVGASPDESLLLAALAGFIQVLAIDLARTRQRVTAARTAAHLDRLHASLEDSTALLLARASTLKLPARLQRERTGEALVALEAQGGLGASTAGRLPRVMAAALLIAAVLANLTWLVPRWLEAPLARHGQPQAASIAAVVMEARPPEYTRLPPLQFDEGDVTVPEFSTLRATLTVRGTYSGLELVQGDGNRVKLYDAGDGRWQSTWWPATATTWQIVDGAGAPVPLADGTFVHRIGLTSDTAPAIRIAAPDARLHEVDGLPFTLPVRVSVIDDHGVAAVTAHATRATGSGERVSFEGSVEALFEDAAAAQRELETARDFDAAQFGLEPGAEIYLHFEAADARPDGNNVARSQTLILRWKDVDRAPDVVLDNAVIQVMPEYFRSQRQIIIDSEALVANRATIATSAFEARAQSLALDQRALRLRYGQFLGEEVGGEPAAMPLGEGHYVGDGHNHGADAEGGWQQAYAEELEAVRGSEADPDAADTGWQEGDAHYPGDGHNHADEPPEFFESATGDFGDALAAISPYAHFHDQEEAATLFDPETRELLRAALRAMWRSEAALRQFDPAPALPHQYEALALIKRVQNRSRVFVARVGYEPTPVDPGRRLTGELDDIAASGQLAPRERPTVNAGRIAAMQTLLAATRYPQSGFDRAAIDDWFDEALTRAAAKDDDALAQATLDVRAAFDEWRLEGECDACRDRVLAYWQRYAPTPPAPAARNEADLDAFDSDRLLP
ncbi:MAG: hypothetical protein AAFY69_09365 [Pseudomonadota bacterium]